MHLVGSANSQIEGCGQYKRDGTSCGIGPLKKLKF